MQPFAFLLGLLLIGYLVLVLLVHPLWSFLRTREQQRTMESLQRHIQWLEDEVKQLRQRLAAGTAVEPQKTPPPVVATPVQAPAPPAQAAPLAVPPPPPVAVPEPVPAPPPLIAAAAAPVAPAPTAPPIATPPPVVPAVAPAAPRFNWEMFMGAKLFAWLGGLALFLGVAFFVKYSFDHDLIPPELRVAIGFATGAALIVGGLRIDRDRFRITSQTLIAAGVVSLYAVTFACNSIYHFTFFGTIPTFLLMVLITAAAFFLAVRLEAQVVAILGMLGGFLTPMLLSTGTDNPAGLFGYLALLDAGLIAVVLATSWGYLVPLSAVGTVLMMVAWADRFLSAAKAPVAMIVCLGFSVLYFAANEVARRRQSGSPAFTWMAALMPFVGLGFGFAFIGYGSVMAQPALYLGYLLAIDLIVVALSWRDEAVAKLHAFSGSIAFLLLCFWTSTALTDDLLPAGLAFYLVFGGLHSAFPLLQERRNPGSGTTLWSQVFPALTLGLMLLPVVKLESAPFLLWPAILLVDVLAIAIAVALASAASVAAALVLTLLVAGAAILEFPATAALDASFLIVIAGFAAFFAGAGLWLSRRLSAAETGDGAGASADDLRSQIPVMSALLPFILLVLACVRLQVPDPSLVFGLGLLLVVLTLGLTVLFTRAQAAEANPATPAKGVEWLPLCALGGLAAVAYAWHSHNFSAADSFPPLLMYLAMVAGFTVFPFLFRRLFASTTGPWATAALSGVVFFPLFYRLVKDAWPNEVMGLLPACFALPPLLCLVALRDPRHPRPIHRLNQLAWFGGAALFFITLIFPMQFDRQWITIGWALEGAALLWLFHRVPHPALRGVGVALLAVAFARLALNPNVLAYHPRSDTPILNWYLYTYGLVTLALVAGARLLPAEVDGRPARVMDLPARALLSSLAVILGFLLLNIEIADYFTPEGASSLTFRFRGSFARDMSYTIAWSCYAFGLLVGGILRQLKPARIAGICLLGVAMAKLFLHDLARLEALYRVGALFAVAIIAMLASYAYQRFLPANENRDAKS